jgi:deazaflavin-dependent oxidoreductase (nitroreductase family)
MLPDMVRKMFRVLNKYFMVPIFRLGLGPIMVNPLSGYIMVMKTIGRKSGKVRYAPVNYTIWKGKIYCISGGKQNSDWFKNLRATGEIEVILPGGAIFASVNPECESADRLQIIRRILQNAGFAGFFEGYNPWKIPDDALTEKTADFPLIEITPIGIGNGAFDPNGWSWMFSLLVMIVVILLISLL